jgi:hypothetical protein
MGHASLMQPARPLPTVRFVNLPLRFGSNGAAAIIAAKVARGHGTSTSGTLGSTRAAHRGLFHTRNLRPINWNGGDPAPQCQWTFGRNGS